MQSDLSKMIAQFLCLSSEEVDRLSNLAPKTYRHYQIPKKKKGQGFRRIYHPTKETKALQYALMIVFEKTFEPHSCAMGYRRGLISPLRRNAEKHSSFNYTLRIDFKDFFPSIRPSDLMEAIEENTNQHRRDLSEDDKSFLTNVCFVTYSNGQMGLPIGAPSSPMISNCIMRNLDHMIQMYSSGMDFVYTRYADDLIFSTNQKNKSVIFLEGLYEIIRSCNTPSLTINNKKTLYMCRNCRRVVTGLTIGPDGIISIGRDRKRFLKKQVYDFQNGNLSEAEQRRLRGYLAFVLDSEPGFYNRLCLKYGADVLHRALKGVSPISIKYP